jgi:hypothetical protein
MDTSKYFTPGTKGFILTEQALATIKQAENAGLKDQAAKLRSDLESSAQIAQQSGWRNMSGFTTQLQVVDDLVRSEISQKEKGDRINSVVMKSSNLLESAKSAGVPVDPEKIQQVSDLLKSGNSDQASTLLSEMSKPIADAIKLKNDTYMKLSQEANKSYSELKPYQRQEFEMSKNIGFASKMLNPESLKDPSTNLRLIEEAKQRDASKQMAREVFSRLQTAQEIRNNPNYMAEFGDSPVTNFFQSTYGSLDQGEFESKLAKLKGGDLAKAMQDIKEKSGTAAGMSEKESSALQASISELGEKLGPTAAKEALDRIIKDSEYMLGRLGVDPALTTPDQVKAVRNNEVPFILADERAFNALPPEVKSQITGSVPTAEGMTAEQKAAIEKKRIEDERLRKETEKLNNRNRSRE